MNAQQVIQKLEVRKNKSLNIMSRDLPTDPKLAYLHRSQVERASLYKEEMTYLMNSIGYIDSKEIFIVSKATLEKKSAEADFASVEEDGYFYQLVLLQSYPYNEVYLLWVESISSL